MIANENMFSDERQQKRRRLMEGTTKVIKKKRTQDSVTVLPNKKAKKRMKTDQEGGSEISSSKTAKSFSKTKKCKKVKVDTNDSHSLYDAQRRVKSVKNSSKVLKKVSKNYHYTNGEYPQKAYKGYNKGTETAKDYKYVKVKSPKIGKREDGINTKTAKSKKQKEDGTTTKSPTLAKSPKDAFKVICDDDDDTPIPSSPTSLSPSFPNPNPTTTFPTPTSGVGSGSPSVSPSTSPSHAPSVSNAPSKFGTTQSPSLEPSISLIPSTEPTVGPTQTQQPSRTVTRSPAPSGSPSEAPTLEQIYRYDSGNCPNNGSTGLECSNPDLRKICDRYDDEKGSFRECWNICKPSFCCIHDAVNNDKAPSCSQDENCAQYAYCYIVWFHFHDTFGPATYLDIEQEGNNFFDVENSEVQNKFDDTFFDNLYFHHFDNVAEIINKGTVDGEFVYAEIFEKQDYWQEPE